MCLVVYYIVLVLHFIKAFSEFKLINKKKENKNVDYTVHIVKVLYLNNHGATLFLLLYSIFINVLVIMFD